MSYTYPHPVTPDAESQGAKHRTMTNKTSLLTCLFLIFLCVFALGLTGCGRDKDTPEEATEEAALTEPETAEETPAVTTRRTEGLPAGMEDLNVWSFLPEEAHVGLVVPSLERLVDARLMPLLRRHASPGWDPDALNADWAAYLAQGVGVEHDGELGVVQQLHALGVDTQDALGAFFWLDFDADFTATASAEDDAAAQLEALEAARPEDTRWVLVLPLRDPENALQPLEARALQAGAEDAVYLTEDGDRILQHPSGQLHFTSLGTYLLLGSHPETIEEALSYARHPLPAFYGTEAMPANDTDEAILLFNLQQYAKEQRQLLNTLPEDDAVAKAMREQQTLFDNIIGEQDQFSPLITTLQWEDEALRLLGRMNLDHYPGMRALTGEPGVHRWLQRLPEATDSYLSLAFSEEMKGNILNMILPFVDMGDTQNMMSPVALAPQLTPLIGDELMLGLLADNDSDAPYTYLAISMENLDGARLLLQLILPMSETDSQHGRAIYAVDIDNDVPFYLAFADRSIIGSNHLDGLKEMIAHAEAGTTTSPNAPIHTAKPATAPRYTGLVLKTDTLEEFLRGLYAVDLLEGDMLNPVTEFLLRAVSELHMFNTLEEPFQQLEITLNLQ